jgi:hypothetical protein
MHRSAVLDALADELLDALRHTLRFDTADEHGVTLRQRYAHAGVPVDVAEVPLDGAFLWGAF